MNKLVVVLVVAAAACAGRPVYVAEGDRWSMPLVDPLARGELTVPMLIDGKGRGHARVAVNVVRQRDER